MTIIKKQILNYSRSTNNQLFECKKCGKFYRWYQAKKLSLFGGMDDMYYSPHCPHCNSIKHIYIKDTKETKIHPNFKKLGFNEFRKLKKQFKKEQKLQKQNNFKKKLSKQ